MARIICTDMVDFFFYQLYNPTWDGFMHIYGIFERLGCFG